MHRGNLEIQNSPVCTDDDTFPHLPIDILDLYLLAYMLPSLYDEAYSAHFARIEASVDWLDTRHAWMAWM